MTGVPSSDAAAAARPVVPARQPATSSTPRVALLVSSITRSGGGVAEAVRLLHDAIVVDGRWAVELQTIVEPGFEEARAHYGATPVYGSYRRDPTRFGFSPGLLRRLLASDADVLHVHGLWGFHCLAALLWHLKTGRPYVVTPHGMLERWILQRSRLLKTAISLAYQNLFLRRAARLHVLTEKERQDVEDVCPGLPIAVVPNFVRAPEDVASLGRPNWWREDLAGRSIALFFGRMHEKKGCMELCDAWERRCAADPDFARRHALVFCGWVDGLALLPQRIADLDRQYGNVIFGGPQFGADKWRSMTAASFMILPSRSEGQPLSVLEAWAVGVPVLMTPECNLPEGFAAGAALEITSDVGDIDRGLADLAKLDDATRQDMRRAALGLIATRFSREVVCSDMIALYEAARGAAR